MTLRAVLDNLKFDGPVSVHIADDGSESEHRRVLHELAGGYAQVRGVSVTNSERGGYGRNVNLASQITHQFADYVLMLEDDWALRRVLCLDDLIHDMQTEPKIGCIRLGYIGYTQPLRGNFVNVNGRMYIALDPGSHEPHVWAGHPRLESVVYQREVGPWPEGLAPGETEFRVAHIPRAREGVVWPMSVDPCNSVFAHVGAVRAW